MDNCFIFKTLQFELFLPLMLISFSFRISIWAKLPCLRDLIKCNSPDGEISTAKKSSDLSTSCWCRRLSIWSILPRQALSIRKAISGDQARIRVTSTSFKILGRDEKLASLRVSNKLVRFGCCWSPVSSLASETIRTYSKSNQSVNCCSPVFQDWWFSLPVEKRLFRGKFSPPLRIENLTNQQEINSSSTWIHYFFFW